MNLGFLGKGSEERDRIEDREKEGNSRYNLSPNRLNSENKGKGESVEYILQKKYIYSLNNPYYFIHYIHYKNSIWMIALPNPYFIIKGLGKVCATLVH